MPSNPTGQFFYLTALESSALTTHSFPGILEYTPAIDCLGSSKWCEYRARGLFSQGISICHHLSVTSRQNVLNSTLFLRPSCLLAPIIWFACSRSFARSTSKGPLLR